MFGGRRIRIAMNIISMIMGTVIKRIFLLRW
jgi:hypothetical protein